MVGGTYGIGVITFVLFLTLQVGFVGMSYQPLIDIAKPIQQ
jgi:hypothetical protein